MALQVGSNNRCQCIKLGLAGSSICLLDPLGNDNLVLSRSFDILSPSYVVISSSHRYNYYYPLNKN